MNANSKLSERMLVVAAGVWVSAANFERFLGVGFQADADSPETVTVQLRKATDASGTGATNFGTAGVATAGSPADEDLTAYADGKADQLGRTEAGVEYTHVSVTISDAASPEAAASGVLICGDARFSEFNLAGAYPDHGN